MLVTSLFMLLGLFSGVHPALLFGFFGALEAVYAYRHTNEKKFLLILPALGVVAEVLYGILPIFNSDVPPDYAMGVMSIFGLACYFASFYLSYRFDEKIHRERAIALGADDPKVKEVLAALSKTSKKNPWTWR